MAVTDGHAATLRAMLLADEDEYERCIARIPDPADQQEFLTLTIQAFHDAVMRRFTPNCRPANVVEFVTDLRISWAKEGVDIDPRVTESLIRGELGDGHTTTLDNETFHILGLVLMDLISDEQLDEAGIDEIIARARERANAQPGS